MIAIHNSTSGFHPQWIDYCQNNNISFKLVNCYDNNIIDQLKDCTALFWHQHHNGIKDRIVAKQILFALEHNNFKVFPDFKTAWHFDDKIAQKYLFEAAGVPMINTNVFFDKKEAIIWAKNANFPKVFKLRGGAGSQNVKLIHNKKQALKHISVAFGKGFSKYDAWSNLKERYRKYQLGFVSVNEIAKGILRLFWKPKYARLDSNESGYIYVQDFIPNNDSDIRVIVIDNKVFAIKRMVRENDFRASGSGVILYNKEIFDIETIQLSLNISKKINTQCIAIDFVYNENREPLVVEISFGFAVSAYFDCPGYWDENLNWIEGKFNPYGWMIESVLKNE